MQRVRAFHLLPYAERYVKPPAWGAINDWWNVNRSGVCVVTGIGGSGKTTTVDRILRDNGVLGRANQRQEHVLIFSFAEDGPERLGGALWDWVTDGSGGSWGGGWDAVIRKLEQAAEQVERLTLVLDSFEAHQGIDPGTGRLNHPGLRQLLQRTAYGANRITILATTRYPIGDAALLKQPCWLEIAMEPLGRASAIELLRIRGFDGPDASLAAIGEACAGHPLTLDFILPEPVASDHELPRGVIDVFDQYRDVIRKGPAPGVDELVLHLLSALPRGATTGEISSVAADLDLELAEAALEASLSRLRGLGLTRGPSTGKLSMHQAAREYFAAAAPAELRKPIHLARATRLIERFEDKTAGYIERLDAGEDAVKHFVAADEPMKAFLTYWETLGSYDNLGNRLAEYARGERICRALNNDRIPQIIDGLAAPLPKHFREDPRGSHVALMTDWALYLSSLGELELATAMLARADLGAMLRPNGAMSATNLADLHLLRGALTLAAKAADQGRARAEEQLLIAFEGVPVAEVMEPWTIADLFLGLTALLMGDMTVAAEHLREAAMNEIVGPLQAAIDESQIDPMGLLGSPPSREAVSSARDAIEHALVTFDADAMDERFVGAMIAGPWAQYLHRGGEQRTALGLLTRALDARPNSHSFQTTKLRLLAGHVALRCDETVLAEGHAEWCRKWLGEKEVRPLLCELTLLDTRIALARGSYASAWEKARNGLDLARDCGLGLLHIDLLIARAAAALELGDAGDALHSAATALFGQLDWTEGARLYEMPAAPPPSREERDSRVLRGIFPPSKANRPGLLAACDDRCRYVWGELEARELYAEAMLLDVAQTQLGATHRAMDAGDAARVAEATEELRNVLDRRRALLLRPPTQTSDVTRLERRLAELQTGKLTAFSLKPRIELGTVRSSRARVMISYSHHDAKLADALADAVQARFGGAWLDRRSISSGNSIVSGIGRALSEASDYVLLLSKSSAESSWVTREWETALYLMLQNPGQLRMHIVRIDATPLPTLLLATKALDYPSLGLDGTVQELLADFGSQARPRD